MTTQYTPTLKLALPVTGELSGTWGDVVNDNITSMIEQAIAGLSTINTWTANAHTLTTANGTTSESRCAMLVAATGGGAPTAAAEIICPAAAKLYVLQNNTSYAVTLKTSAGTGVAVAAGDTAFLFCDGTNVNSCVTTIVNGNITGNLTVGGNATINGNTTLGNATSDTITATARFASDLVPSTDNARDLGSAANSWRSLWIDGTATMALVAISGGTIDGVSIGATTAATLINVDNLRLDGNTISSTDTNGNVVIAPNGTGDVQLDADTVRVGDAAAAATLTSNGAGALTVTTGGAADLTLSTNAGVNSGTVVIANGVNGNITLTPNGTGDVILSADRVQMGDSNTDTTLTTNGTGSLNLTTNDGTNSGTIQIAQGINGNITLTPNGTGSVSISKLYSSGNTTLGATSANTLSVAALVNSNLLFTDATYDIGASGATRPRDLFLSRNLTVGGTLTLTGGVNLNGNVTVGDASTDTLTINSTITSNLIFTDNTYDIGASGATRPRTLYLGTSLITPSITNSGLTSGRVTFASTGGLLADSAALTFDATNANLVITSGVTGNGFTQYSNSIDGGVQGYVGSGKALVAGSGNTTLGVRGETSIFFGIGSVYAMGLDSSGNLGLGALPNSKLTVVGSNVAFASGIGNVFVYTTDAVAADIGGTIALGGYYTGTSQVQWAGLKGGKNNATSGDYGGYLSFNTRANGAVLSEVGRFDSAGNLGIGIALPTSRLHVNHPTASTNAIAQFTNGTTGALAGNGLYVGIDGTNTATVFNFYNSPLQFGTNGVVRASISAAGVFNANTLQTSGTAFGSFSASKWFIQSEDSSTVRSYVTGPNASTNGVWEHYVATSSGTPNLTQRWNADGNIAVRNIGLGAANPTTSGTGITFPATQSASSDANTLDDYEEGTWTPTFSVGGTTFTSRAWYIKVGVICHIGFNNLEGVTGFADGATVVITGLPFNIKQDSGTNNYKFGAGISCIFSDASDGYNNKPLAGRINPVTPVGGSASAAKIDFRNISGVTTTTSDPFSFGGSYITE